MKCKISSLLKWLYKINHYSSYFHFILDISSKTYTTNLSILFTFIQLGHFNIKCRNHSLYFYLKRKLALKIDKLINKESVPHKIVKSALSPIGLKFTQNVGLDVKPSQKIFGATPHANSNNVTANSRNSKIHTFEGEGSKILKFSLKIVDERVYTWEFLIFFRIVGSVWGVWKF